MSLSMVSRKDAAKKLEDWAGGKPDAVEVLADMIRTEVHAWGQIRRGHALSRIAQWLDHIGSVDSGSVYEVFEWLERAGDIVMAPFGICYATPTRVVLLERVGRVFSSVPTRILTGALGRAVDAEGVARTVGLGEGLDSSLAKIGGVVVTPEEFSGLGRAPIADAAFLDRLDVRLRWESKMAGYLDRDGVLDWRTWAVSADGSAWSSGTEGRLWRGRTRLSGYCHGWTSGLSPSATDVLEITQDEADRARFALARGVDAAARLRVSCDGREAAIEVPGWLPRAEARWLALHARHEGGPKERRWHVDAGQEWLIAKMLQERLGLVMEAL